MGTGLVIVVAALVLALGFGLYRAATDGRFRGTKAVRGASAPADSVSVASPVTWDAVAAALPSAELGERARNLRRIEIGMCRMPGLVDCALRPRHAEMQEPLLNRGLSAPPRRRRLRRLTPRRDRQHEVCFVRGIRRAGVGRSRVRRDHEERWRRSVLDVGRDRDRLRRRTRAFGAPDEHDRAKP